MTERAPAIGFMQGRLSPQIDGKIQAFPARHWREEFALAQRFGFPLIEWTIDHDGFDDNPVMSSAGQSEIRMLQKRHGVVVASVTADSFMHAPFFKATGDSAAAWFDELRRLFDAAMDLQIRYLVVPLVDSGRVDSPSEADRLHDGLRRIIDGAGRLGPKIVFESDLPPHELRDFIAAYPAESFGINYDIGNSASLGHDPRAEIAAYGARIDNVHVKDRLLGGTTVPLGAGAADLPLVFRLLSSSGYRGSYILQTARATDGDHCGVLCEYRDRVRAWLRNGG